MWYRFQKGEIRGKLRVEMAKVAWYDMTEGGVCFDEDFVYPRESDVETLENIGRLLPYVETEEDENNADRSRVFIYMDNGDEYELLMKKQNKQKTGYFDRNPLIRKFKIYSSPLRVVK